jgi:hypothetical protein
MKKKLSQMKLLLVSMITDDCRTMGTISLFSNVKNARVCKLGVREVVPGLYGSRDWLLERNDLDVQGIRRRLLDWVRDERTEKIVFILS